MRKLKRAVSVLLCGAMLSGLCSTISLAAPTAMPAGLTRTDVFAPSEMLEFYSKEQNTKRHNHGATLTEMPNGDLLAVWFSSNPSGERDANECRLIGAWLPKYQIGQENAEWSKPFVIYNLDGVPSNNPVVYVDENERLWVFFNTILNGQWVSAIPRYMYADPAQYVAAQTSKTNPDWHFPEPMYVTVGDTYGKQGRWNGSGYDYDAKGDLIRYITAEQYAEHPLAADQCVKVTSRFNENDTRYITDRFVVGIQNQVDAAVAYLEKEKPYDDEFGKRNDIVIESVNEGIFTTDPYKSEPSLRDGAIWRASGADNDAKTWNPAFRRMGWQTKNPPIEVKLPSGDTRLLLPLYSDSLALSICAYTDDSGATWAYSDPIAGLGNIQGAPVQKADGTIYQYFRSGKLDGKNGRLDWKVTRSESHDYGVTWENIHVEDYLRNDGGMGLDVLPNGDWVMAHNQDTKEDLRSGTRASATLSVSKDEGVSWQSIMLDTDVQADGKFTGKDYQYPGVICTSGGYLVTMYTNGGGGPADQTGMGQVMRSTMLKADELDTLLSMDLGMAKTDTLEVGGTKTLATNGTVPADDLVWRTTDPTVLTVDANGGVNALKEGKAKIIATSKTYGTIGECLVTVGEETHEPIVGTGARFTAGDPTDIFAPVPNGSDHTHGSSIAVLPDGEQLVVWFQGNGERDATTTCIMASRLPKGATEWTEPFVIADTQDIADINPALYVDSNDRLWLFYYPVLSAMWETSQPMYAYADKGSYETAQGHTEVPDWTWSDTIPIKIGPNTGNTVDMENDHYVNEVRRLGADLKDYLYQPVNMPGSEADVYDPVKNESIYEDGNTGGGVNPDLVQVSVDRTIMGMGGMEQQRFTPTVADKVGPDADGNVPRSGYPLLRRIGWQTKNPPLEIVLREGTPMSTGETAKGDGSEHRLIIPFYSDGLGISINAITDDFGQTWKMSDPVVGRSAIQASMVQREDGDIVAYLRNNGPRPYRVCYTISHDDGETWDIVKLREDLLEPGIGNCMAQVEGKNWVFISNSTEDPRNMLTIALSENEGKTWPWRRTIELDTRGATGSYHYPTVTADDTGKIYISYSIDYSTEDGDLAWLNNIRTLTIDKDWIKAGDWTDSDTANKKVSDYARLQLSYDLPADFNKTNKGADGKYAMEEIEKIVALMPTTVKGYLTYNNRGDQGLALATTPYVDIPVAVDKNWLQQNFEVGTAMKKVPYSIIGLPDGITAEMLPILTPYIDQMVVIEKP